MALQPITTRRSTVPIPEAPKEKPVPKTWEEEELSFYEPKRVKAVAAKKLSDARAAMLVQQLPHQWNALRQIFAIRCESINERAEREVLRVTELNHYYLQISREDDQMFDVQFDVNTKRVRFNGKPLGYEREYELTIQTFGGVDSTAWFSPTTFSTEQPDDLVKMMISLLIRADQ